MIHVEKDIGETLLTLLAETKSNNELLKTKQNIKMYTVYDFRLKHDQQI